MGSFTLPALLGMDAVLAGSNGGLKESGHWIAKWLASSLRKQPT